MDDDAQHNDDRRNEQAAAREKAQDDEAFRVVAKHYAAHPGAEPDPNRHLYRTEGLGYQNEEAFRVANQEYAGHRHAEPDLYKHLYHTAALGDKVMMDKAFGAVEDHRARRRHDGAVQPPQLPPER